MEDLLKIASTFLQSPAGIKVLEKVKGLDLKKFKEIQEGKTEEEIEELKEEKRKELGEKYGKYIPYFGIFTTQGIVYDERTKEPIEGIQVQPQLGLFPITKEPRVNIITEEILKDANGNILYEAKKDKDFLIIARVEALISELGMNEAIKRADAYEKAGADAILIHSKQKEPDEIFEFADTWKGNLPIVAIPTTYDNVRISDLHNHKIKMAIYANQTLRTSHAAMLKLLKEMKDAERISDVKEPMSTMNEIFELQEMYDIKNKEKDLENELKKLGYIN